MVYLGIKERSERKYTILYISQFDKNSVCFSKKIGIRSLLTGLVQVACFGIVLNYVYIAYLAVIAAYFTQLCLSAVQIIWTWLACSNKKIYIDEYTIEADWGILVIILQYPLARAHNVIRKIIYSYYAEKQLPSLRHLVYCGLRLLLYIISGIGRCGWDILECYALSVGLDYSIFSSSIASKLRIRLASGIKKNIYLYKYRAHLNPEWLKRLLKQYSVNQIKVLHKEIDQIYYEYTKIVACGATSSGRIKDHLCYIDSSGRGVTFTHNHGVDFNITSTEGLYCAYIRIDSLQTQDNTFIRNDLMALYSESFLRSEMMSLIISSLKTDSYPLVVSSLTRSKIILIKDYGALGLNMRKNIQRVITLKNETYWKKISELDLINISKLSKEDINGYFSELYVDYK